MNKSFKSVFLGTALLVIGCGEEVIEQTPPRPVTTIAVGYGEVEAARTFTGTAQTDKTVNLSFRSAGIVTRFDIKLGTRVRKGQLLAQLDNVQSRLGYEQAVSALNSAESQMNTAKLAYDRVRLLYEKGSASPSDFESAKNSFRTAEGSHLSAQRSVEIQQEQVRYGYIYAPESGTIASVFSDLDENVAPGQVVAVLNAGAQMEIALGLPESFINRVSTSQVVSVTFASLPGEVFAGTVSEISPSVDAKTATYPVRVALGSATEQVRSGMSASVRFEFETQTPGGLIVPAKAIGKDAEGHFVFVIEGAEGQVSAKKTRVTMGELSTNGAEVLNGLYPGQLVATAGLQTLLDGQRVRLD